MKDVLKSSHTNCIVLSTLVYLTSKNFIFKTLATHKNLHFHLFVNVLSVSSLANNLCKLFEPRSDPVTMLDLIWIQTV